MASKKQIAAQQERKRELSDQLAISRETINLSRDLVKEAVDVKKKLKRVLLQNQTKVALGSAVIGLAGSMLFFRKGKTEQSDKKGVSEWVKKLIIGFAIKKAKNVALDKAKQVLIHKIQQRSQP